MSRDLCRISFRPEVPAEDLEASLILALFGVESLHGEVQVRLDLSYTFDPERRVYIIDRSTPVGRDLNKLVLGFVSREFGPDCFRIEHVDESAQASVA